MMRTINEIISKLESAALNPAKTVAESRQLTGKEAIGCFPIYTPEEIIYAAGYLPVGMWGGKKEFKESEAYFQGFCCSIIKTNLELGMRGAYDSLKAVIIPGLCDTLKCTIENWKCAVPQIPMIGLVYPQNRWTGGAEEYLVQEYKRVRSELEKITGVLIPEVKIQQAFELYEEYRAVMREFTSLAAKYPLTIDARKRHLIIKAGYFMDKAIYMEEIQAINCELKKMQPESPDGFKAVVTGLICEPIEVVDILVENGIAIAADDMAQESRQFRTPARSEGNVWQKMAGRILDQRGCTFLAEQKKSRGDMLIDMVKKTRSEAVIVFMMKFCDPEEFDYPVYKKQLEDAGIPLLYLEIDQQMDSFEQLRTRIQSFAEMI